MNSWDKLISELVAHQIEVTDDAVHIYRITGDKKDFSGPRATHEAIAYISAKADENSKFLSSLWKAVSSMHAGDEQPKPSNQGTRRLFIAAVKHLVNQASLNEVLRSSGVHEKLAMLLLRDVVSFSQAFMSTFIEYRISIDWVTHLVLYDRYRAELLEVFAKKPQQTADKVAAYFPTDSTYVHSTPWSLYRSTLTDVRGDTTNPLTEDPSRQEDDRKKNRFADRFEALVGKHMVGDQPKNPLLPKEGLPTEDIPQEQIYEDPERWPTKWEDLSTDGNPGSNRMSNY